MILSVCHLSRVLKSQASTKLTFATGSKITKRLISSPNSGTGCVCLVHIKDTGTELANPSEYSV